MYPLKARNVNCYEATTHNPTCINGQAVIVTQEIRRQICDTINTCVTPCCAQSQRQPQPQCCCPQTVWQQQTPQPCQPQQQQQQFQCCPQVYRPQCPQVNQQQNNHMDLLRLQMLENQFKIMPMPQMRVINQNQCSQCEPPHVQEHHQCCQCEPPNLQEHLENQCCQCEPPDFQDHLENQCCQCEPPNFQEQLAIPEQQLAYPEQLAIVQERHACEDKDCQWNGRCYCCDVLDLLLAENNELNQQVERHLSQYPN